jgi:hypothetical protein
MITLQMPDLPLTQMAQSLVSCIPQNITALDIGMAADALKI